MNRRTFLCSAAASLASPLAVSAAGGKTAGGISYQRTLNVEHETDVFVAGGGPSGICAALAAVRAGKSVFLAESSGAFGGAATAAYVPAFAMFTDGVRTLVGGIGAEIRRRISPQFPFETAWTPIDLEELKRVCDDMVTAAKIRFSFFTTVCDAAAAQGRIDHVVLSSKRGLFAVRAKVYIDCTGDADLIAYAGGAYEKGDATGTVMPCTLCSQWSDIDFSQPHAPVQQQLEKAIADGIFSVPDFHLPGFFVGPDRASSLGRGNIGHTFGTDPTDERSLTRAMIDARRRMPEYARFYREYVKGYENARLASTAPYLGVRESRRVTCDYTLNVKDFMRRASFPDEVGRYCYPVDVHNSKPGDAAAYAAFLKEYEHDLHYKKGESYGIPYRALVPKSFSNALVAGRCMGTDQKMQASIRVMPGCFITGQAAGTAAALACAAGGDVRAVRTDALQDALRKAGAVV